MEEREHTGNLERRELLDENEQLRTALEASLDENSHLLADRDRLVTRVAALAREVRAAGSARSSAHAAAATASASASAEAEARQSQSDEELRVTFEELQVLSEELAVTNASLNETNALLEARVEDRTSDLAAANAALNKTMSAFQTLIEGIPQLVWRSAKAGEWTWSSPQWSSYTGQSLEQSLNQGWLLALHPDDRPAASAAWEKVNPANPLEFEARIYHVREERYRHFRTRAAPVLTGEGQVVEWLGTSTDVDDILQLQHRQGVLVDELQHRTRNLMAVVQAVLQRTIKESQSLEEFGNAIALRMQALSRAQGLLSRRGIGKVMFNALLREELSAHVELDSDGNGARVSTSGPHDVPLQSSLVQTLALALHELTTNATKYGALSSPDGRLDVHWELRSDGGPQSRLHIAWTETGLKAVRGPEERPVGGGFGRELIERALPYQFGAQTSYRLEPDGVHCTIEVNIS